MTLTQLAPPYPIFTDKSGSPLDKGYLYFGTANLNPETNPITVYYDSALTQPAAQPLRTSNGYVMRNGSPAIIYANSQFSVTVRDKNRAMVIYSPVGYGILPGTSATSTDQITYNEGGTGAVSRILTSRLQDYVSVKDFGAVGDGTTDDTAAIQAAIAACPGRVIFFPNGKYKFTQTLQMVDVGILGENVPQSNVSNDPGVELAYYGSGYAMILTSWRGQTWEKFLLKSYAAGTSGICGLLYAGNVSNVRIEAFDQVSFRLGTGTLSTIVPSPSQVASEIGAYYWKTDNLLVYNTTISGSNAQRGVFVSGGFPSTNGNNFRNTVVFGRFDVLYEINGNTNWFTSGECTPQSPIDSSTAYRLGTAANSNCWNNIVEGVYYETGNTTNFAEFGSGALSNELRDFNYEVSGAIQPKVSDLGWGNNINVQPRGFNFPGSVQNKTQQNLVSNSYFQQWSAGLPVNWYLSLGGGTWSQDSTTLHGSSPYSAKLVCAANRGIIAFALDSGLARNQTGQYKIEGLRGQTLVAAVWCKSSVAGFGNIKLGDGTSYGAATHSGSGNWELLTAMIRVSDIATQVDFQLRSDSPGANQTGTIYFSEPVCFFGSELTSFEPRPINETGGKMFGKFGHAPSLSFTDGAVTPSVQDGNLFTTANTAATSITNFTNGWAGQIIYIRCNDANTTLTNNANIQTTTGANKLLSSGVVYKLAYFDKWREF